MEVDVPVVPVFGLFGVPLFEVDGVNGFFVAGATVGFFFVVDVGLLAGGLLVGRDVLPPIIPPPVTPPSCWANAAPEQVSKKRTVTTNGNRRGRTVVMSTLLVFKACWRFGLEQGRNGGRIIMRELSHA